METENMNIKEVSNELRTAVKALLEITKGEGTAQILVTLPESAIHSLTSPDEQTTVIAAPGNCGCVGMAVVRKYDFGRVRLTIAGIDLIQTCSDIPDAHDETPALEQTA